MFRAVRHWWESGRGKVTARLLLFELFVGDRELGSAPRGDRAHGAQ